ncbi:hypothetical protein BC829DRAFT_390795 [Chytridium lagenaria]|nr:hypothetical protein BC829DRAFT_390795 [Chytridium lagenaria]
MSSDANFPHFDYESQPSSMSAYYTRYIDYSNDQKLLLHKRNATSKFLQDDFPFHAIRDEVSDVLSDERGCEISARHGRVVAMHRGFPFGRLLIEAVNLGLMGIWKLSFMTWPPIYLFEFCRKLLLRDTASNRWNRDCI